MRNSPIEGFQNLISLDKEDNVTLFSKSIDIRIVNQRI